MITVPAYFCPKFEVLERPIFEYAHYIAAGVDPSLYGMGQLDDCGNMYVDLAYSREMSKCCGDDSGMAEDEFMVVQTFLGGTKKAVIERDTDILTKQELYDNHAAVEASILEELRLG